MANQIRYRVIYDATFPETQFGGDYDNRTDAINRRVELEGRGNLAHVERYNSQRHKSKDAS